MIAVTIIAWLPIVTLPAAVVLFAPAAWPRWGFMWLLAWTIFVGAKWLTWLTVPKGAASAGRQLGYLALWPGLDAPTFLHTRHAPVPAACEWWFALGKTGLGVALVVGAAALIPVQRELARGWVGMIGIVFFLHFGLFHLLSLAWRAMGVAARPIMDWPILAHSVSEFWGRRWNAAFRDLTHRFLFRPLTTRTGAKMALLLGFVVSGLIHDLVISLPAGGGYGGPTAFFLIQAGAIFLERSALGKRLGLGRGRLGWAFTMLVLLGPLPLLFHVPFVRGVIVPFLNWISSGHVAALEPMAEDLRVNDYLPVAIFLAGCAQLCLLIASALVPLRLNWKASLGVLPRLNRQLYWVYGGYVVLAIVANGLICIVNADALADGTRLSRCVCGYVATFWGIRLSLQTVLDAREHLTTWWLRAGYHTLTLLFAGFTGIFIFATFH